MVTFRNSVLNTTALLLIFGCSNTVRYYPDDNEGGTAGNSAASGGEGGNDAGGTGGTKSSTRTLSQGGTHTSNATKAKGGASATGGMTSATGGVPSTGGQSSTGGTSVTGGQSSTGGVSVTGGKSSTGGVTSTGGISATGGKSSTGGTSATGGTTSTPLDCSGDFSGAGWDGCRGDGCRVCVEKLEQYPLYFVHHKNCIANTTCENTYYTCSANCPPPTDYDTNGGPECDGDYTASGWQGCRGNGCLVCKELITAYPKYLKNHPNCAMNEKCEGSYFNCSTGCPAPTNADK